MKKFFIFFIIFFLSSGNLFAEEISLPQNDTLKTADKAGVQQIVPLKTIKPEDTVNVTVEKINDAVDKDTVSADSPLFEIYVEEVKVPENEFVEEKQEAEKEGTQLDSISLESPASPKKYSIKTTKNVIDNLKLPEKNSGKLSVSYPTIGKYYALNNTIYQSKSFQNVSFGTNVKSEMDINSDSSSSDFYTQFKYKKIELAGQLGNTKEIKHFGSTTSTNIFAISNKLHLTDNISLKTKYSQAMEQKSWFKNEFGIIYKPKVKNYSVELNAAFTNDTGTANLSKKFSILMNYEF